MDVTCSPQSFSHPLRHLQITLVFLLTLMCQETVTETTKTPTPLNGEVGGEVTFHCLATKNTRISSLYLQKGGTYVNGYHVDRKIPTPNWENTRTDNKSKVYMNHLNVSHAGTYTCHIMYEDMNFEEMKIELIVTANYTKPNVTISCSDTSHICKVTCTSYDGYPIRKILWDGQSLGNVGGQMWKVVENPPECNTMTELCTISITASLNCSSGVPRNLSCSVYDTEIISQFSICESIPMPPPASSSFAAQVFAVFGVVTVSVLVVVVVLLKKICKAQRGHRNQRRRQEPNVEEGEALRE